MKEFKVKVCGNTRAEDVRAADLFGADMVGVVVDIESSRRSVSARTAAEIMAQAEKALRAVLLLDPPPDRLFEILDITGPDIVHFTGDEAPSLLEELRKRFEGDIFKSIHLPPAGEGVSAPEKAFEIIREYEECGADTIVIDTRDAERGMYGGTGKVSDWKAAAAIVEASPLPVLLAGGINMDNVDKALREVEPHGVDLASGLEKNIGEKDHELMKAFIEKVKNI